MDEGTAEMDWDRALDGLERWHRREDREVARAALEFIESELRLMIPPMVRDRWPKDLVEDGLRGFMKKLLEKPLKNTPDHPRAYFSRSLKRHFIDIHRREPDEPDWSLDDERLEPRHLTSKAISPEEGALEKQCALWLHAALATLTVDDRVALKLKHGPHWLDEEEILWLAERGGCEPAAVRTALADDDDTYALTRIFDPGDDDQNDKTARRRRMERFRKRCARAQQRLRTRLEEMRR